MLLASVTACSMDSQISPKLIAKNDMLVHFALRRYFLEEADASGTGRV